MDPAPGNLFLQMDGKHGICADATGAPGMAAPALDDLLATLHETETDALDALRHIGHTWGKQTAGRFTQLLAEQIGQAASLSQFPVELFLDLCRDYLQTHGFGTCAFIAQEPTLSVHIQDGQPSTAHLLTGFFEGLIGSILGTAVICRASTPLPQRLVLDVFQAAA
ncbi:MAG: hypothetical protein SNJ62_01855 [Chloracidobacterium sp.]